MGLCAPSCLLPVFNREKNCWCVGDTPIPNWSPSDVKFKKKEEKMLDEDQKKVVINQLTEKKDQLHRKLASFTEQAANIGKKLHDTLTELDDIHDVLDEINGENEDDEE